MSSQVVDHVTIEITPGPRSVKARLYYAGSATLRELTAKTEAEALDKARAWLAKLTPRKRLMCCAICRNGVELQQHAIKGKPYKYELRCDACGGVTYRGATKLTFE